MCTFICLSLGRATSLSQGWLVTLLVITLLSLFGIRFLTCTSLCLRIINLLGLVTLLGLFLLGIDIGTSVSLLLLISRFLSFWGVSLLLLSLTLVCLRLSIFGSW